MGQFSILLWKNFKMMARRKMETFKIYLLPLVFVILFFVFRVIVKRTKIENVTIYNSYSVDSFGDASILILKIMDSDKFNRVEMAPLLNNLATDLKLNVDDITTKSIEKTNIFNLSDASYDAIFQAMAAVGVSASAIPICIKQCQIYYAPINANADNIMNRVKANNTKITGVTGFIAEAEMISTLMEDLKDEQTTRTSDPTNLFSKTRTLAGVVFSDLPDDLGGNPSVKYELRFPGRARFDSSMSWFTDKIAYGDTSFQPSLRKYPYSREDFLSLQRAVDLAIIDEVQSVKGTLGTPDAFNPRSIQLRMQKLHFPPYYEDFFGQAQRHIGYCPQFEALIDQMTVTETLIMYGRIRGVNEKELKPIVENLIDALTLRPHAKKQIKNCSGGNKRKCSIGVALIGDPQIIFLDEPTTGVDPEARRKLWNVLSVVRERGKTIILTTHSMEKSDALCTNIAIMVNGQFTCLGSLQHLKSKYGEGFTVIIKIGLMEDQHRAPLDPVVNFIETNFLGAILKDMHEGYLNYQIVSPEVTLSDLFAKFEAEKESLNIEDYSISQTTLEQVFINFARSQTDELKSVKVNPFNPKLA